MANLMRDHIGLGKISGRAKPRLQFIEKRQIEVELFVTWTVEGTDGSACFAAT